MSSRGPYGHSTHGRSAYHGHSSTSSLSRSAVKSHEKRDRQAPGVSRPGPFSSSSGIGPPSNTKSGLNASSASFTPSMSDSGSSLTAPTLSASASGGFSSSASPFIMNMGSMSNSNPSKLVYAKSFTPAALTQSNSSISAAAAPFNPTSGQFSSYNTYSDDLDVPSSRSPPGGRLAGGAAFPCAPVEVQSSPQRPGLTNVEMGIIYHLLGPEQWPVTHIPDSPAAAAPAGRDRDRRPAGSSLAAPLPDKVASFSLVSTASCAPPVLQPAVVSQSYLDRAFAKSDQVARPDPDFGDGLGLGLSSGLSLNSNSSGGSSLLFSNSASGLGSGLGSGMGPGMGSSSGSWALPAHLSESSAPALSSGSWTLSHIPNTFSTTAPVSLAAFPEQPRIHALQLPYNPPVVDCPIRPAVSLAYKQYKPLHLRLFMAPPIAPAPPKPLLAHHAPARDAHARDKAPAPPASPQELCDADVSMLTPHGEERLVDMVWSRGIVRKCYLCPALATTQCLSSAKARLPVAQTLFCSFACLKKQWDRQGPRIAKLMASASLPADAALSHGQPRPFSFNNNGPATPDPAPASGLRPVMGGAWFSDEDEHAAQQAEVEALQLQHLQYVYNNKHNARLNAVVTQQNQATVVTGGACAPDPARDADACASCSTAHTGSCTASPSNASAAASPSAGAGGPTHIPGTGHPHPHLHPLVQQQQQAAAPIDTVVADSFLMPYSWTRYEALCCRFPAPFTDLFTVIGHGARYVPTQADQYCSLRIDAAPAVVVDQPVCKEASLVAAPPPRGRRHGRSAQDAAEAPSTPRVFIDPSLAQRWLRVETLPVVSVANSKPPRKRLLGLRNKPASPSGFKVLHYNILSDHLALPQLYHYCPPWALSWEYRRKLILQEIRQYDADIVCLQEVQGPHWKALEDDMAALGYQGKFYGKTRGTTFADGCATLYKRNKFVFRALHEISLDDLARDYLAVKNLHDERQYRRLLRGNVCVVVELEQIHPVSAGPPRKLCVANTHIFWDPTCPDVKLLQTWQLLSQLAYRFSQAPLIICGDLNSKPDSSVYEFLTSGSVKGRYPELDPSIPRFSHMPNAGEIRHPFHLSSAYAHVYGQCYPTAAHTPAEPLYTNYTAEFKGTLDYVFYSAKHLVCTEVLQLEDEETLAEYVALPSPKRPSDHIPLVAYIDWL